MRIIDDAPTVDLWHYPSKGELPEKKEVPYQCLCKIHAVDEVENVFYAALWFDGSHFYMPDIDDLYWEENDYTDIVMCWQYIMPPKEEVTKQCTNCGFYKNNVCERTKTHPNKPKEWTCLDWKEEA